MIDLRPTQSLALQLQKWGRVLRRKEYPAIILDHAGNITHGFPCEDREWTLEDTKKPKTTDKEPSQSVRTCDNCFYAHPPAPKCPECGYTYPIKERTLDEVEGQLVELSPKELKAKEVKNRKQEQAQARTLEQLIALGRKRGMKYPEAWGAKILSARMRKR